MAGHLGFPQRLFLKGLLKPGLTDIILNLLGEKLSFFDPLLHHTVNATIVNGGEKVNVIPSEIDVQMDGRILPGFEPTDFLAEIKCITGNDIDFEIAHYDAFHGKPDMGLFNTLTSVLKEVDPDALALPMMLPGVTDGRFFARLGIQTYGFLPMKLPRDFNFSKLIHAADERIPEDALLFGADSLYRLIERY
jgi:acetylornithine deacetylase/succinyl-diaminopimelate desuccinylase-like protein